jgi:N-acetylneuraminic acid mutarotase
MKTHWFITRATAFLLPVIATLHAGEKLNLETAIYIFRTGDFHEIKLPGAAAAAENHGIVFNAATAVVENHGVVLKSPATVNFDQVTLSLEGSQVTWSGSSTPPGQFTLVAAPATVPLTAGKPVTMTSSVASQYLERLADNSLQVREIPAEAPEAPHFRLTFTAGSVANASEDLLLACDLDIATVCARENVPGVALEVGKPVIARFKDNLQVAARAGQWAALLLKAPNGSDYSLLLLLKVVPAQAPKTVLSKVADYHLKTERCGAAAVAWENYVYVIGGRNSGGILGDIERFDVRTHESKELTDKLTSRYNHGAALIGGKIYVFGGIGYELQGASPFEETVDIFDVESGKITHGTSMPAPRGNFATAALGQKIYVLGGISGEPGTLRQTNRTMIYDVAADSWSEGIPMPTPRETRAAVVANGEIIVAGGYHHPNVSIGVKTVECFDPGKNQWLSLPDLGRPVSANSAAVLGNYIFLFGNYDPADQILAYDLATHTSTVVKNGFTPASQSAAVALNGMIYVVGGTRGGGFERNDRHTMDDIQVFALGD